MAIELEDIKKNILTWVSENINHNFVFRPYQLESIQFIIKSILNDTRETTIIEAPTGSGKSFISIIASGVLHKYYDYTSYILCSDLFLWKQYKDTIDKYNLKSFGYLKGTQGNYQCAVNGYDFKYGRCQLEKVSYRQLKNSTFIHNNMYTCVYKCEYLQQRFRAESSPITLMTYQLWLHYMNLVKQETPDFDRRTVIFCDECHNIPNIVQQFCTPIINPTIDIEMFKYILDYADSNNITVVNPGFDERFEKKDGLLSDISSTYTDMYDNIKIINYIYELYAKIGNDIDNTEKTLNNLIEYNHFLKFITEICECIHEDIVSYSTAHAGKLTKSYLTLNSKIQWIENYISSINHFLTAISNTGHEYLLMEYNKDEHTGEYSYTLNCAKEDYLCNQYLLKNATYKVMLSATVGGHAAFDENMGVKYTNDGKSFIAKIPSTFNFDKSPIYYIPKYKMNYANKVKDFPAIIELVLKVCTAHVNSRGIIHTGSYENATTILQNAPKHISDRFIFYRSSKEKDDAVTKLKLSKNGILIGPTLTEGIDLPDDLCRFMIIVKMPYPNITSRLVKKKTELFPLWYNSVTSNIIIQSIGRGVRNENDYCQTYIMDGCFTYLYEKTKEQYPDYIQKRIKYIIS